MLSPEKKVTLVEYMQMPIYAPYQYINGCLVDWPSRTLIHQSILMNLITTISAFQDENKNSGTFIMGPIETILDELNSFQPDFVYIGADNDIIKDYIYGAADIVFEILCEQNAYYDLRPKKDTYEKYGVKEYIIIDPVQESAYLYILKAGAFYLHQKAQKNDVLNSVVLPGLSLKLEDFFIY